jgi:putative ATPase
MPECDLALAQAVVYLSRAPKSNDLKAALAQVRQAIRNEPNAEVPLHIRNAPTKL